MLDKILIIDFEDSFTYNIANVLFSHEKRLKVIEHHYFFSTVIFELLRSSEKHAVILGPGPGHPDEYQFYYDAIENLLKKKNIYLMGICLGHQIMGKVNGYDVATSLDQVHGLSVKVHFKEKNLEVQRYNSLGVFIKGKEVDICEYPHGISYQFHPESVGTADNDIFFKDLLSFIK